MKLYQQLLLFVLAATAIPLTIGLAMLKHNESLLEQRLLVEWKQAALRLADVVSSELSEVIERTQSAVGYVDLAQMSQAELKGLLGIIYKQSEQIVQVSLFSQDNQEIVPGVFLSDPSRYPEYSGRLAVSENERNGFLAGLPLDKAKSIANGQVVVSNPYRFGKLSMLVLSIVLPIEMDASKKRIYLAVEVSLREIATRIRQTSATGNREVLLVDANGRLVADSRESELLADHSAESAVAMIMANQTSGSYLENGQLRAYARVKLFGWGVVLSQSHNIAWAQILHTRWITLAWTAVSIICLLVFGLLFTSRITNRLKMVVKSAEAYSKGDLSVRIDIQSNDELGLLAKTFNHMGGQLMASREEIEAWNRELETRIEQRTKELEVAHERLLQTSKLAAIGQLGSGVAHEINNPLVGILGNTQLLLLRHKDDQKTVTALKKIESGSKRCRDIVQNLLRFSEMDSDQSHVECDINQVLKDAFSLTQERITNQRIEVVWNLADQVLTVIAAKRQLMQVFLNLFNNARAAMPDGGSLTISSQQEVDQIVCAVKDTGKGIEPQHLDRIFEPFFTTKDVWTNTGMGLSVAFRIISDHAGQIEVDSRLGEGSVFRIVLPRLTVES